MKLSNDNGRTVKLSVFHKNHMCAVSKVVFLHFFIPWRKSLVGNAVSSPRGKQTHSIYFSFWSLNSCSMTKLAFFTYLIN